MSAIAVDGVKNIYIAGSTQSSDLPGTQQAFQKQLRGFGDAFVAKFDAEGRLQWTTYLGGRDSGTSSASGGVADTAKAIAVDPQGNVYVAGSTASSDFPTANAYQTTRSASGSLTDGFLAKIDPTGSRLLFSTYLGGTGGASGVTSIAVAPTGELWAAIDSSSAQFPRTDFSSTGRVFVAKFQSSGQPLSITRTGDNFAFVTPELVLDSFGQPNVITSAGLIQLDASGTHENFRWRADRTEPWHVAAGPMGSLIVSGRADAGLAVRNAWQPEFDPAGSAFIAVLNGRGVPDVMSYVPGGKDLPSTVRVATDGAGTIHASWNFVAASKAPDGVRIPENPDGPIFTTIDRGDSWQLASHGLYGYVRSVAIDGARDILYASTEFGIFRSTDRAGSWSRWTSVDLPDVGNALPLIAIDPRDPTTMYGGDRNLWRIDWDGALRTRVRAASPASPWFDSLAVSPHDGSVWLGISNTDDPNRSGVEVSFDRGVTWVHRDGGFRSVPTAIIFDPRQPGRVFVRLPFGGVSRSDDNGLTWQSVTAPLGRAASDTITDFAIDPFDLGHYFSGSRTNGLFMSPDAGRSWTTTFASTGVSALAVSPVPPYQVYARYRPTTRDETIIFSGDRGASWFAARHANQRYMPTMIVAHPTDRDRAFAVSPRGAVPFVMRMQRSAASATYESGLSSIFPRGRVDALTASIDGETILGLNGSDSNITILRIHRD